MKTYISESQNQSQNQKILLFGGSGFFGRNITEQLGHKYHILAPTRKDIDIEKDIQVSNEVDVIINCINANDNLQAFLNITHFYNGKMINIGSGAEYDKSNPIKNVKEEDFGKRIPKDDYGLQKYYISKHIELMDNIICLRPFGVFGKYEDTNRRFISKAILDTMMGKKIEIFRNVKFSYIWVNDLIKIIDYFIMNKPKHKFYNVGGHQLILKEIAKKIGKYKKKKWGMANEYTCDDSRVLKETGIEYTPFDESLEILRRYYESS